MDSLTTIFIISFIIIIFSSIRIIHKFYKKYKIEKNIIDVDDNQKVYDGSTLSSPAKKKKLYPVHFLAKKVDCHSNVVECNNDSDCQSNCLTYKNHKRKCSNGLCIYNNSKTLCENGGQIASYFSFGRIINGCICPESFIGQFCQIPNKMKPGDSRTFDIIY